MGVVAKLHGVREPVEVKILCTSKIKKWAYENAYTLIFMSVMFFVSWWVTVLAIYFFDYRGR